MKILKYPTDTKQFKCKFCGCLFEASSEEYKGTPWTAMMHDNLGTYNCKCPCCGGTAYTKE